MMERSLFWRWVRVYIVGGSIVGSGLLLYKYSRPTDEELISKFSPEVRREYEANKKLREEEQRELIKIVQESANSKDPIWKTGPLQSPFERGNLGSYSNNTVLERAKRQQLEKREQEEIDKVRQNIEALKEQQRQEKETKKANKSWWKFW
ncbi:Cbp4p PWA37_001802 [Arxiozyma heterogenica]